MQTFREIDISGDARERGNAHGEQLRDEIAAALDYYRTIFNLTNDIILNQAAHFRGVISAFNDEYAVEIDAIADGSNQDPLWITALNARTEILGLNKPEQARPPVNECTSMCFAGPTVPTPILGQTWDWGKAMEDLCAIVHLTRPDGHEIRMLTEPGIIGKIGMNNAGLGVCLNILTLGTPLNGVPIHVMLRAILDCRSAGEAAVVIDSAPDGKSSNVMIADRSGTCFDREFAGDETFLPDAFDGHHIHTNHYLGKPINASNDPLFDNSRARMATAREGVSAIAAHTVDSMKILLSDRSHDTFPIFRPYLPDEALEEVGTVATIVMDVKKGALHIRKGCDPAREFSTYRV